MKQNVTESQFIQDITGDEYNSMSYHGAKALYNYLVELEQDCDMEIEHDIVAIRCDYSEYDSALEYAEQFNDFEADSAIDDDEVESIALEFLQDRTTVIDASHTDYLKNVKVTSYVIQSF